MGRWTHDQHASDLGLMEGLLWRLQGSDGSYAKRCASRLNVGLNNDGNMAKVIHVHLLVGKHEGLKDFYFTSISAVYTVLTAEEVGASKGYLLHAGLGGNGTVITKRAVIKQSTLISGGRGATDEEIVE